MSHYQVIIVGGGQAGLSASYCLKKENIKHLILDRGAIGDTWSKLRWDSFCLVTPNWQCRLPGFHYDGADPMGFMKKDEIVDYIKRYAASFDPPIQGGTEVLNVQKKEDGHFYIETSKGNYTADNVIIASGGYHKPNILKMAEKLPETVQQIHSSEYKNPEQLQEGTTLVVGTGQSGAQIAEDLHIAGRKVVLAVGNAPRVTRRYRGKDVVEWLEDMGTYNVAIEDHPSGEDAKLKTNHYVTGRDGGRDIDLRIRATEGMELRGSLKDIENGTLLFASDLKENLDNADATANRIKKNIDNYITAHGIEAPTEKPYEPSWVPKDANYLPLHMTEAHINAVVWCTGFKVDYSWLNVPIYDQNGHPKHYRGVTEVEGLSFLGLPWMHTWGSGRFSHIARDAEYLCNHIMSSTDAINA